MQQEKVRLQKILANQGYGSRRSIESLIKDRRICINGQIANLGDTVDSSSIITIDNEQIIIDWDNQQTVVLVLNKPVGVICSTKPQGERKTIFDLLPQCDSGKWITVGRLDVDTSGLLLITNNGSLAHKLMHPKSNIERKYVVTVKGKPSDSDIKKAIEGVNVDGDLLQFSNVSLINTTDKNCTYNVCLYQGKNREIRRLWWHLGYKVIKLHRYQYGPVKLSKQIPIGHLQKVPDTIINSLQKD